MAINLNDLADALTGAQEQPTAPRASRDQYGTIALDAHGTPTVMLDGGEDYAPCTCMVGVHHGDRVLAHVVNHKIVVFANITAPTTDDATALVAIDKADAAAEAADAAGIAAASAQGSADAAASAASIADGKAAQAIADAATAAQAAEAVEGLAQQASQDAAAASTAANKATYALSDVEKVVGTVNWIAEHGSYELTQDTAIVPGKVYYTCSGTSPDYVYTVVANPEASGLATYYELHLDESVQNFLASHLWLDNYGMNLSVDSANGYRIHQGTVDGTKAVGTYIIGPDGDVVSSFNASGTEFFANGTSMAEFGGSGARIGKAYVEGATDNESHMELDYHSLQLIDKEGSAYFHVSDLRDASGKVEMVDIFAGDGTTKTFSLSLSASNTDYTVFVSDSSGGTVTKNISRVQFQSAPTAGTTITVTYVSESQNAKAYTLGKRYSPSSIGAYSLVEGRDNRASATASHAEGYYTTASGNYSHAEGTMTTAGGFASHAEGRRSIANGSYSHAEGQDTTASNLYSHAEGNNTKASATASHAEGNSTKANGNYSHAEGDGTETWGARSHAQNYGTIAASNNQTAMGKYNVEDTNGDYALIIGNGTADDARSNALAVTWDGDVYGGNGLSCTPVVLFDDDAKALSGAVTLAETAANFSRLVICYRSNDGDYGSAEVWHPDGKTVSLLAARTAGGGTPNVYLKSKTVLISGTTIDTVQYASGGSNYYATSQVRVEGSNAAQRSDYIAITQVIGYR